MHCLLRYKIPKENDSEVKTLRIPVAISRTRLHPGAHLIQEENGYSMNNRSCKYIIEIQSCHPDQADTSPWIIPNFESWCIGFHIPATAPH